MNTERVLAAAGHKFSEEYHPAILFMHRYIEIPDARETLFHFVQFVIVCGKQGACPDPFVCILHHGAGDGHAVIGRSTSADFVINNQTLFGGVFEDVGDFGHFHHESGSTASQVIACADTRQDAIDRTDASACCRHETADKGQLKEIDALTAEVEAAGKKVTFDTQVAGDQNLCTTVINTFTAKKVDLIMANATPALLAAANATTSIPVLGTSVTDYAGTFNGQNFTINGLNAPLFGTTKASIKASNGETHSFVVTVRQSSGWL